MRTLAAAVLALAAGVAQPAAAAAQEVPQTDAERVAAVRCDPGLADRLRPPVVLLHGTGVDAELNWSWGYAKDLRERGHGICVFDLPRRGAVDVQSSVLITRTAIREAAGRGGGRRVSVIGHSQGGAQAMLALRAWPELGALVEDVVTLAGVFDRGSEAIRDGCRTGCSPAFHQFSTGSNLLRALARRPLPAGISFTAIGTLFDDVVTPQPAANEMAGARSMQLQDVCPGRRIVPGLDHIYLAADAVAHALAVDALTHEGPADPARISPLTCALQVFPTADLVGLAALSPRLVAAFSDDRSGDAVPAEPPLRCPLADDCDDPGPLVQAVRVTRATVRPGRRLVLRVSTSAPAALRLVVGRTRGAAVRVGAGRRTAALRVPRRPGRYRATLEARPAAGGAWTAVRVLRFTVRR